MRHSSDCNRKYSQNVPLLQPFDQSSVCNSIYFREWSRNREANLFYQPETDYVATPCSPPDSCLYSSCVTFIPYIEEDGNSLENANSSSVSYDICDINSSCHGQENLSVIVEDDEDNSSVSSLSY